MIFDVRMQAMVDETELKKQFALALFSVPGNPFRAACVVFPDDLSLACAMAVEWHNDPMVLKEIEQLKEVDAETEVANKKEALELAWNIAQDGNMLGKDRVAALKLFAEINNFMPDKTINKNIVSEVKINKVMAYKDHGDNDEWEKKALEQQRILANG